MSKDKIELKIIDFNAVKDKDSKDNKEKGKLNCENGVCKI